MTARSAGIAALPMYDWPELASETDGLWAALRESFRAAGIAAPEALSRDLVGEAGWRHPGLVLGQACGLPFVRGLDRAVTLLGAPDYRVPGCPPGFYRSAVVVRADDPRDRLDAFRGARLAVNGRDSQSGYAAILHQVAPLAAGRRFFGSAEVTGAHRQSIRRVAASAADLAAIDFVTWRIACRHLPEAGSLRVMMLTEPTPGLPLIATAGVDPARHRAALAAGFAALDPEIGAALGIAGFAALEAADYGVILSRIEAAEARLAL